MKILLLLFIALSFGCDDNYNLDENDKKILNQEIDSIYALDQNVRLSFFEVDSIYKLEKFFYMQPKSKKIEVLSDLYDDYQKKIDSLNELMKSNDFTNTERLIEITKEYGFPSEERLDVYKAKAYMIFVHSPREYFHEIVSLVNKETNEGRINDYQKEYIFWHINGRKGMPPMMGPDGEVIWQ